MAGAVPESVTAAPRPSGDGGGWRALARALLAEIGLTELAALARAGPAAVLDAIDRRIAAIDDLMAAQVNAILHHPRFQRLEASWRGLAYLVEAREPCEKVRLRALTVSWPEISRDMDRAIEFDQGALFAKVYNEEFGMPGGTPYGLLVLDHELRHRPGPDGVDDVATLRALSGVASAAFAPLVTGAAPSLFGVQSFRELHPTMDFDRLFAQAEYRRWRALQDHEDMRFVGVALPRLLIRRPLGDLPRTDGFRFAEDTADRAARGHLWANPAYAFAGVAMRAFDRGGWFADIRGTSPGELSGGLVTDLPAPDFATDAPGVAAHPPLESAISTTQERALSDLGFLPLAASPYTPYPIFYASQSAARPARHDTAVARTNARMSSMLNYVLCVSRFAHYIKVIGRDAVGSFLTAEDCEERLQAWLLDYSMVPSGFETDLSVLAARPLSDARVEVRDTPGKPGSYRCTIYLKPHYQLDEVVSSFRLTTEIAPGAAA